MAGYTNLPFRMMVKKFGAGLVTTEMVSAMGLALGQEKSLRYIKIHPLERPVAVQIFGSNPEVMARAAQVAVAAGTDLVDINMGCPVKKVVKTVPGRAHARPEERGADCEGRAHGLQCSPDGEDPGGMVPCRADRL